MEFLRKSVLLSSVYILVCHANLSFFGISTQFSKMVGTNAWQDISFRGNYNCIDWGRFRMHYNQCHPEKMYRNQFDQHFGIGFLKHFSLIKVRKSNDTSFRKSPLALSTTLECR